MAKIEVKVTYKNSSSKINSISTTSTLNNNTCNGILNENYNGAIPFMIGLSKLGDKSTFFAEKSYNGYVSNSLSSSVDGSIDFTITIIGSGIKDFFIRFDEIAKQYATSIKVDDTTYINNSTTFSWSGDEKSSHTIKILKWNKFGYPIRITSILTNLIVTYDRRKLKSVTSGSELIADNQDVSYGILSQYGSVDFIDDDGSILEKQKNNLLKTNLPVIIYLDGEQVGSFLIDSWSYKYNNKTATIQLTDELTSLSYKNVNEFTMIKNTNMYDVFDRINTYFKDFIGNEIKLYDRTLTIGGIELSLQDYLKNMNNYSFKMNKNTLLGMLQEFCNATQGRIYKDIKGNFIYDVYM